MIFPGYATLKRRARSAAGWGLRRWGILPGGVPDRLGEDRKWRRRGFEGEIVVFFPDTRGSMYQLRPWYGPLHALHEAQGVTIVCMDSKTASLIRAETPVPVMTISQESFLDEVLSRSNVKAFFYVNYNQHNFLALRLRSVMHVSLLHGDSDKSVSVSNQAKAFDFAFVAGRAAIDRYSRYTSRFEAGERCIVIGRPQLDTGGRPAPRTRPEGEPPVVLYAPTWEGGHSSVSYSSVVSHGRRIVKQLTENGFRVLYRPHPLTGQRLSEYGEADKALRRFLRNSDSGNVSVGRSISQDFSDADLLICDVSSVATEWLVTNRPLIVTISGVDDTREAATELLNVIPRLAAEDMRNLATIAKELVSYDPQLQQRRAIAEYYLGDTSPGASLQRFLAATREVTELRDEEWLRIRSNEIGEPRPMGE